MKNSSLKRLKKYNAERMIKNNNRVIYFNTLDKKMQNDILKRIEELIDEESIYCDKGNYKHLCNLFSVIAIYEVLQKYGKSEEEAFKIIEADMVKYIGPSKERFQKLSKKKWFWSVIKMIVPIGFKNGSGYGWRYTWHKNAPKNEFRFETNECIYQKILSKRNLLKLGTLFCKCDVINFGELYNIDFQRTKTLCYGDDECNFIFIKYKDGEKFTRTEGR